MWLGDMWWNGDIAPHILIEVLDRCKRSVSCPGRCSRGEIVPGSHWIGGLVGLDGSHSMSERFGEEENLLTLLWIETQFLCGSARRLVAIPTTRTEILPKDRQWRSFKNYTRRNFIPCNITRAYKSNGMCWAGYGANNTNKNFSWKT
jgi:hypothetical protein